MSVSHASQSSQPVSSAVVQTNLNTTMGCFVLMLPIILWLIVTAHRKQRAATLKKRIQQLESLWLLSLTETSS